MAKRINLVEPVRTALEDAGISTVLVVSAINAALGELDKTKEEHKTGAGRVTKTDYKVSESVTLGWMGKRTAPLEFDAWHSAIEKAHKIASFDTIAIPAMFTVWLQKMHKPVTPAAPAPAPAADPKSALKDLASKTAPAAPVKA